VLLRSWVSTVNAAYVDNDYRPADAVVEITL
jgi:hypothetical protein